MSELRESLEEYIAIRRSLGFKLPDLGSRLRSFIDFAEGEGASYITTELALRWAQLPHEALSATCAARLAFVRRFAVWRSATDRRTQVPPEGLLPHRVRRARPYIYSDDEISGIVLTAGELASATGLRARTYSTLFGLLAVTGMRVSEAVSLDRTDVDLDAAILTVRQTKFGKTRLVPVHPCTRDALRAYGQQRDQIVRVSFTAGFFVSEQGTRITADAARYVALGSGAHVRCIGKGRKHRSTPLRRDAQTLLRAWLQRQHDQPDTVPTINYLPSWRASNHAESKGAGIQPSPRSDAATRHNLGLGIMAAMPNPRPSRPLADRPKGISSRGSSIRRPPSIPPSPSAPRVRYPVPDFDVDQSTPDDLDP